MWLGLMLYVGPFPVLAGDYPALLTLAEDWRQFEGPSISGCLPDYGPTAMHAKTLELPAYRRRLAAIDRRGWTAEQQVDYRLIEAEMNGLDFDLRVRRPWARDPAFYATLFGERSDVPQHEGVTAAPAIDLFAYEFPLTKHDQRSVTCLLGAIPALLDQAKLNLRDSNARDLWVYGTRALQDQSEVLAHLEAGTLEMRTLDGTRHGSLAGADSALKAAVRRARTATDAFARWLGAAAPRKTGPSGVGKDNYNWYLEKVHLVPYDWDQQVTLLRRELERARSGLVLEEFHNRALPPLQPADSPEAFRSLVESRMQTLTQFLIDSGIVADKVYYRDAMRQQVLMFVPPERRNFFLQGAAREPLGLFSHDYHWIELARMKEEPTSSAIRRLPALSNMFDSRSEGLATAMEETLMQAGLYEGDPRGREVVWIMLANRAARGLASLYVQANEMTLQQAGRFHAEWTPKGWSDPSSDLVAFEQSLYLRQPGYGTSYITGKMQFERLISDYSHQQEAKGAAFSLPDFFARMNQSATIPFSLIESEIIAAPLSIDASADGSALIGTWRLLAIDYAGPNGERVDPFYQAASTGLLIYDRSGWMSVQISAPQRASWAVPAVRVPAAADEDAGRKAAAFDTYYGYFGTWDFDPRTQVVTHHLNGSVIPAETGLDYAQTVSFENGHLVFTVRSSASGHETVRQKTWEKMSDSTAVGALQNAD